MKRLISVLIAALLIPALAFAEPGFIYKANPTPGATDRAAYPALVDSSQRIILSPLGTPAAAIVSDIVTTGSLNLTSTSSAVSTSLSGISGVSVFANGGTGGTLIGEVTNDGTNWTSAVCNVYSSTGFPLSQPSSTWSNAANAQVICDTLNAKNFRVRVNSTGTGTCSITINGKQTGGRYVQVQNVVPGTSAANLGKAEEGTPANGDVGVIPLYNRVDNPYATGSSAAGGKYALGYGDVNGSFWVHQALSSQGGATAASYTTAASTNSTNIKASAGNLAYVIACNNTAALKFAKFYNSASAPTCGSGTPVLRLTIPAHSCSSADFPDIGIQFSTGIGFCITGAAADADTTATAANDVFLNYGFF